MHAGGECCDRQLLRQPRDGDVLVEPRDDIRQDISAADQHVRLPAAEGVQRVRVPLLLRHGPGVWQHRPVQYLRSTLQQLGRRCVNSYPHSTDHASPSSPRRPQGIELYIYIMVPCMHVLSSINSLICLFILLFASSM